MCFKLPVQLEMDVNIETSNAPRHVPGPSTDCGVYVHLNTRHRLTGLSSCRRVVGIGQRNGRSDSAPTLSPIVSWARSASRAASMASAAAGVLGSQQQHGAVCSATTPSCTHDVNLWLRETAVHVRQPGECRHTVQDGKAHGPMHPPSTTACGASTSR
jgi:hypothetical protein